MLALKYKNEKLFSPVPLQLTTIVKAETNHIQSNAKKSSEKQIIQNKLKEEIRLFNNKWPQNKNLNFLGLSNLGNTCYLNSMFQSILNIPQLFHVVKAIKKGENIIFEIC